MKFNEAKTAIKMIMMAGRVAMLQGERGIGKSTMAKTIAKELGLFYINIDCNLLKEGEAGGLPISEDRTKLIPYKIDGVQQYDEQNNELVEEIVIGKKTSYAPYSKLLKALELCEQGQPVLLFLDELNRAESAVIQECMNLILNREINGLQLPDNCYLLGAMNPPGGNENGDINYNVTEMDSAAVDRFIWINLESSLPDWLDWAVSSVNTEGLEEDSDNIVINPSPRTQNIHGEIVEFLIQPQNKDFLNVAPTELRPITASPRSWEMLSDVLFVYEANKNKVDEKIFLNIAKGCVGDEVAAEFLRFTKDNSNPLILPEAFFKLKDSKDIEKVITSETPLRQYVLFKNLLNHLIDIPNVKADMYKKLIDGMGFLKADMMVSIMKTIKNNYAKVHKACSNNEKYLDLFMNMYDFVK